ncbi:MAG: ribonuclease E inhibitor RraB [Calditrichaeota bacterium]|nr:ribonuclease E inhibitor RraB [Calditrichota bacterium]HQU70668.1 ribonuclease E inhibitor RraB [Calditrichia bacterium]
MPAPKSFPDDPTGEVLQQLKEDGANFDIPHSVDFYIAVATEETAQNLGEALSEAGYEVELAFDEEEEEWAVVCICEMLLDYDKITETEKALEQLSQPFGGELDGWGTYPEM